MRRAAVSVVNNTAEAFERRMSKDFARLLAFAKAWAGEVRSVTCTAQDLDITNEGDASSLRADCKLLARPITGFQKRLR